MNSSDNQSSVTNAQQANGLQVNSPDAGASVTGAVASAVVDPHCVLGVPGLIDAFEFARRGRIQTGVLSVHRLQRLLDGLADQPDVELVTLSHAPQGPGLVRYVLQGRLSSVGKPQLVLTVQATLLLECQRCLGPLLLPIDRQAVFDLVKRESDLDGDSLDEENLDQPEKIVGSRQFDMLGLIEDELILEVPYVPRHEVCTDMAETESENSDDAGGEEPPSPFAVLGQLKTKG